MHNDTILVIVVATALAFDYTNGFHDTANAIATMVSTRAMAPRVAVLYSAILNFAGAFISLNVAATVAKDFVDPNVVTPQSVFGGLIGAIIWNLATWYLGLPSSSSHALIGGVVGAVLVAAGTGAVSGSALVSKLLIPALIAPVLAFGVAGLSILIAYRIVGKLSPGPAQRGYRLGQVLSGGLLSLAHGRNAAQKTMDSITLARSANDNLASDATTPTWVTAPAAATIALGTCS